MASQWADAVGVKLATIAPHNPDRGLPRIQGLYVLFERRPARPRALIDGIALTPLRNRGRCRRWR